MAHVECDGNKAEDRWCMLSCEGDEDEDRWHRWSAMVTRAMIGGPGTAEWPKRKAYDLLG